MLLGDLHGSENARADFEEKQIRLTDETCIPCRVVRTALEVGFVAPSAWAVSVKGEPHCTGNLKRQKRPWS